jgi:hypothetical protein
MRPNHSPKPTIARRPLFLILALGLLSLVGCKDPGQKHRQDKDRVMDGPILKVAVMADGRITANGAVASLTSLRDELHLLAQQKGVVYYYRENGKKNPSPELKNIIDSVMEAIIHEGRPVRLSRKPDYSDSIVD